MTYTKAPNAWLPGWSEDGTNITIANALEPVVGEGAREQTFPELTAAEADGATGSIAQILFALLAKISSVKDSLDEGQTLSAWSFEKTEQVVSKTSMNVSYTITFNAIGRTAVANEFNPID